MEFHTVILYDPFKGADPNWWSALAADGRFRELIGDAGAAALANALATGAPSLAYLGLNMNHVGDEGAGQLASALGQSTTLTTLKLDNNAVDAAGAKALAAAAADLPRALDLPLRSNPGSHAYYAHHPARATPVKERRAGGEL